MNLLHHLVVGENLRRKLQWPSSVRGQVLLGAIAPDAHTELAGVGRSTFHPPRGQDLVAAALRQVDRQLCSTQTRGRAFAASVIAHLVADEMTRRHEYHLPPHAPTGFQPVEDESLDALNVIEIADFTRSLMRARSQCGLGSLGPDAIDQKRWEVLGRWPLTESRGRYLVVEPLATLVSECTGEAIMRMYRSTEGASLLGSWRP